LSVVFAVSMLTNGNKITTAFVNPSKTNFRRNHKKTPVEIHVVEHLYRWNNWEITRKSDAFTKKDSQTIEFRIPLNPDEERTVTYTVHYSW